MEVIDILKRPFEDVGKLIVGSVLGVIPIVNITLAGYGLDIYKDTSKLPDFEFRQFILGLKITLIGFIYGLIPTLWCSCLSLVRVQSLDLSGF